MTLRIYNTLSRKKEPFETLEPEKVRLYVCGPTVYDKAHVGHAMSVLVFDIIRRYLEYRGYEVLLVMNYTDVDDRIIERANEMGVDPRALADRYMQEYQQHLRDLNILPATVYPRATAEIDYIIQMVAALLEQGYAYSVDGDVYFRVRRRPDYGKLSGRQLEEMQAGARIDVDERKEHPVDFALWKARKAGEPSWPSPWGDGRPGWHIECSAMSLHHLGEQIDIHGGGNDLIFPHHENEIAQTESLTGKPMARYWVHNGMMQLAGEKMSKSLGNLVTVEKFLSEHSGDALRLLVLNASYRGPLAFRDEAVDQAERALDRLRAALRPAFPEAQGASGPALKALEQQIEASREGFVTAMDDDFNTAGALGHIFDLVRGINQARDSGATQTNLEQGQALLRELTNVLGLRLDEGSKSDASAAPFIDLLVTVRDHLRREKQWQVADLIRDRLAEMNVVLEDSKGETTWRWG